MPAFQGMWPRWRQALALAGTRGVLCFGPNRGRAVTYTNPRRWLPESASTKAPTGLADLVRRYLSAYGPATPQHFARWLNASPTWAADLFASLDDELEPVEVEGSPAWQLAGEVSGPDAEGVRLLPYFDAYVVAGQPRALLFPPPASDRALAGGQAGNFPVLLVDGTVAGVWHLRRAGRKVAVTVEPLGRLSAAPASRAGRAGGPGRRDPGGDGRADRRSGVGRPARLTTGGASVRRLSRVARPPVALIARSLSGLQVADPGPLPRQLPAHLTAPWGKPARDGAADRRLLPCSPTDARRACAATFEKDRRPPASRERHSPGAPR